MAIKVNYTGVEGNCRYVTGIDKKIGLEVVDLRVSIYPPRPSDKFDMNFEWLVKALPQYEFKMETKE